MKRLAASLVLLAIGSAPVAAQWYGGYYASTPAEGAGIGMAAVISSAGFANYMNSAAAINLEQARSQYLDNQIKYTQTYYDKKRMHQSYVDSIRKPQMSSQRLAALAKAAPPVPLSEEELDPVTGKIAWPMILRQDDYEPLRRELDQLFAERADEGGNISSEQAGAIAASSKQLSAELKKRLKEYPSGDYMAAKRFVERLSHEGASL